MKQVTHFWLTLSIILGFLSPQLQAQETDTLNKFEDPTTATSIKRPFFKSKGFRATIVPAVLIGYGISTIKDNGIYSSYDLQEDLQREFPNFHTKLDDHLIYAPFVELALAYGLKVKGNHDLINTGLLILKAEAINSVLVLGLKDVTNQVRPDGSNNYSFPSGHTAHAFLAASILHNELRHRSQWYGIGAYTIATSVGALRMLNNKHWQSDVLTGAGIGILSSHLAYLSHRNRWGNKPTIAMHPTYIYGTPGIGFIVNLDNYKNRKIPNLANSKAKRKAILNRYAFN